MRFYRHRHRRGRFVIGFGVALLILEGVLRSATAADKTLDFSRMTPGSPPAEYRASVTGGGPSPEWRVVTVETDSALPPLTESSRDRSQETVMAQLSEDATDERFPLLIYEPEEFGDFVATLRFRTVKGRVERMAGLAFRLRDEGNYYVIRASSLGNNLRFYKFVNGVRSDPIGPEIPIPSGRWHTLEVRCAGNSIRCRLNGEEGIPALVDTSFLRGKIALWTKSDSVSHFSSLRIEYDALKTLPQRLVDSAVAEYPRLLGVSVYVRQPDGVLRVVASSDPALVGTAGSTVEERVLTDGQAMAGTARDHASAVFPLRDRNGDPRFALRLKMRTFAGQTDNNVAARGLPIAKRLEEMVAAADASGD